MLAAAERSALRHGRRADRDGAAVVEELHTGDERQLLKDGLVFGKTLVQGMEFERSVADWS